MYCPQIFSPKEAGGVYFLGEIVDPRSWLDNAHIRVLVISFYMIDPVQEPGHHVQQRHHPDGGHCHPGPRDGHQVSGSIVIMTLCREKGV